VIDATVRLAAGAMSDLDSARVIRSFDRGISAPSYTRPPSFEVSCSRGAFVWRSAKIELAEASKTGRNTAPNLSG
jgi:hypothetical protein